MRALDEDTRGFSFYFSSSLLGPPFTPLYWVRKLFLEIPRHAHFIFSCYRLVNDGDSYIYLYI